MSPEANGKGEASSSPPSSSSSMLSTVKLLKMLGICILGTVQFLYLSNFSKHQKTNLKSVPSNIENNNNNSTYIISKKPQYRIPTFMIIGTQKGGTTKMYKELTDHPVVGNQELKEVHYFDRENEGSIKEYQPILINNMKAHVVPWARKKALHFLQEKEKFNKEETGHWPSKRVTLPVATVDASPMYMFHCKAAERIKRVTPWMDKFIVTLRNPVDRAYSAYRMWRDDFSFFFKDTSFEEMLNVDIQAMKKAGLIPQNADLFDIPPSSAPSNETTATTTPKTYNSFRMPDSFYGSPEEESAWLQYFENQKNQTDPERPFFYGIVARGFYSLQLRIWLRSFPLETLLVFKLEAMEQDTSAVQTRYQNILKFLGLPKHELKAKKKQVAQFGKKHKERASMIGEVTKRRLEELYKPYNEQLAGLLGSAWENPWKVEEEEETEEMEEV